MWWSLWLCWSRDKSISLSKGQMMTTSSPPSDLPYALHRKPKDKAETPLTTIFSVPCTDPDISNEKGSPIYLGVKEDLCLFCAEIEGRPTLQLKKESIMKLYKEKKAQKSFLFLRGIEGSTSTFQSVACLGWFIATSSQVPHLVINYVLILLIRTWGGVAQLLLTCLPLGADGTEESVHRALLLCDPGSQGSSLHEEAVTAPLPVTGCERVSWSYSVLHWFAEKNPHSPISALSMVNLPFNNKH
ncbi:uncharacterized protein LOC118657542 isoform X3 [Myotis myotis]|uniref:uncharacterized protein LOC118657542 isoform X3 n=1 Tax=Myotis myotis TaxID=51298 RepID=UPI001749183D|nr:uncharacterized protein LOC118657542 isoform X3 [Myotis myotis]